MKNLLLVLSFLFQIAHQSAIPSDRPVSTDWAEELKDGLKLTIKTDKSSYLSDEIIVLRATFANVSDKPISISKYQLFEIKDSEYFTFGIIVKSTGFPVVNKKYGGAVIRKNLINKEFMTIVPNATIEITKSIDLREYGYFSGDLQIKALYHSYWNQEEIKEVDNLWGQEKGTLYSKPIVIRISNKL